MKREERVCKECDSEEEEDVCQWLLQCSAWDHLRQPLLETMEESREDFPAKSVGKRAALVLSLACKNYRILSIALCGQLGSYLMPIIHAIKQSVTPFINIDPSLFFTWYS